MKIMVYDVSDGNKLIHKDEDGNEQHLASLHLPRVGERVRFKYERDSSSYSARGLYRVVDIEHEYGDEWDMTIPSNATHIIRLFVEKMPKN